jgi:hypothetical protein
MAKKNKLQNIKAIEQMIDGSHKFQTKKTVGFSDAKSAAEKASKRKIGDVWEEVDPITGAVAIVEQKDGFRIRKTKNSDTMQSVRDYLRTFPNCQKDTCTCIKPSHLDEKMRKVNGMCYDCTIEFEHELKNNGEFETYALEKVRNNALSWLDQAEQEVEILKKAYTEVSKVVINGDGLTENVEAKMTPEEFESTIEENFKLFKADFLKKLDKQLNKDNK